jgi:hypothetical protein
MRVLSAKLRRSRTAPNNSRISVEKAKAWLSTPRGGRSGLEKTIAYFDRRIAERG